MSRLLRLWLLSRIHRLAAADLSDVEIARAFGRYDSDGAAWARAYREEAERGGVALRVELPIKDAA